ncbi:SBBP repeat-containing protein [Sorangium sp. So ce131]|uniref:SBBP repeat-containing protein n=1 Tax=Sorangium sp. So ce131 TaxID=3133282 RepID=UPI003F6425AB
MKRDRRKIRSVLSCAGLLAAAAGGCNALIGLEVGELDPSQAGAGAAPSAASSTGSAGGGGAGPGGAGPGGAGPGGAGPGGAGSGGGDAGSGAGGPFCDGPGGEVLTEPPSGWGETVGFHIGDLAALEGTATAAINEVAADGSEKLTVARWSPAGARDAGYGLSAAGAWGTHLAVGPGFAYVAGDATKGLDLPRSEGLTACRIGAPVLQATYEPSFVVALDPAGKCSWAWGVDSRGGATTRGLAATSESVVMAVEVVTEGTTFGRCAPAGGVPQESVLLAALRPADGACQWSRVLGARGPVTPKVVLADSRAGSRLVTVVGDYDTLNGPVSFGGETPFESMDRDLFVARYVSNDGAPREVTTLSFEGDQLVATHGAALLPGGDVVIVGTYRGRLDWGDGCSELPDAAETDNFFVARVSDHGVAWSRGFGDPTASQTATGVAVDSVGSIYVTGQFEGELVLDNTGSFTTVPGTPAGFLIKMDSRGNILSGSKLGGDDVDPVSLWAVAAGRVSRDPVYVAGTVTGTLDLGFPRPLGSDTDQDSHAFIAGFTGIP